MPSANADQCKAFESALYEPPEFIIKLKDCTWRVDGSLLAAQSEFFAKVVDSKDWKEGQERSINLHDDESWIFARLLQYVYYDTCCCIAKEPIHSCARADHHGPSLFQIIEGGRSANESKESVIDDPVMYYRSQIQGNAMHLLVYLLADKYCMPNLKERAIYSLSLDTCKNLVDVFQEHLHLVGGQLKTRLAVLISTSYNEISMEVDTSAKTIKDWLLADSELCLMVMDLLNSRIGGGGW
ncbi:hypothetical protein PMZ80_004311 [Knufia obscura]|uniref:BTB domain-containing protein n=1 Tax=Knufia obscura TaxID=1635080 RepID=A0ABR0RRR1_9EURO|nr:hypothetical protein PMZ80_004311 [Knufia obscura]